jgi:hypothetical protein
MADRSRGESQGPLGTQGVRPLGVRRLPIIWWHSPDGSDGGLTPTGERAPDPKGSDVEAILNDLYASGINASISWIWDGGFHATLRAPEIEECALPTIRDAVLWLRDKGCQYFPDSDFGRKYGDFV